MTDVQKDGVTIEVTVAAPVETVWHSLRDPAWIRRWHGWHFDGLDEEIELIYGTEAREGEQPYVLLIDGGDQFVLSEHLGGTLVRITRAPPGGNPEWDAYYDDITEGWTSFLQQLRFALEHQPGRERRTLFFSSEGLGQSMASLGVDNPVAGERFDVSDPSRPLRAGEVWFVSDHQVGLTLDDLGPGLVVAGIKPTSPASPDGGAMAILSTYGLDDAAFAAVRERWSAWWRSACPGSADPVE